MFLSVEVRIAQTGEAGVLEFSDPEDFTRGGQGERYAERFKEAFVQYAQSTRFYVIDIRSGSELGDHILDSLAREYGLPAGLSTPEMIAALRRMGDERLQRILDYAEAADDAEEQRDRLVLGLLLELYQNTYVDPDLEGQERQTALDNNFRDLVTTLESGKASAETWAAFDNEFIGFLRGERSAFHAHEVVDDPEEIEDLPPRPTVVRTGAPTSAPGAAAEDATALPSGIDVTAY
jgi:hypothetical protein